ncbi:hypothetical protein M9458_041819, partial [Cirrhinus mrigala]
VYVAAISAYHIPLGGSSVGRNPLVTRFLCGTLRLRPPVRPRVPPWDLTVVLEALCRPSFKPIEESLDCHLTVKTVLLLALTLLKCRGSSGPFCGPFLLGLCARYGQSLPVPLSGLCSEGPLLGTTACCTPGPLSPSFREPDQQKLNCMCPVRALDTYVHRAAMWRRVDQLFVCYGPPKKGLPASKQTLSRWIVDAITLAYDSLGLPSTRSMAASKAFLAGVPMQDICNAVGWSTPLTF